MIFIVSKLKSEIKIKGLSFKGEDRIEETLSILFALQKGSWPHKKSLSHQAIPDHQRLRQAIWLCTPQKHLGGGWESTLDDRVIKSDLS